MPQVHAELPVASLFCYSSSSRIDYHALSSSNALGKYFLMTFKRLEELASFQKLLNIIVSVIRYCAGIHTEKHRRVIDSRK
jgi:hypothetical protein